MKVLVTGGSGVVGQHLVPFLQKRHDVSVFDIQAAAGAAGECIQGNILDIADCEKAVDGMDVIVHLAATYKFAEVPPEKMVELNCMGTVNILQAAENKGVRKVVYISTDSVVGLYWKVKGFDPDYLPINEDHRLQPQDPYGLSKMMGEQACRAYTRKGALDHVILRPCWIWFPENAEGYRTTQENYGNHAKSLWGHTHIDDLCRAVGMAMSKDETLNNTFFIVSRVNFAGKPAAQLIKEGYPKLYSEFSSQFQADESLVSGAKAERVFGFKAEKSWKDILEPVPA